MKIVFDSLVFALHKFGGVITYWNEFIKRFQRDDVEVNILTVPVRKYLNDEFIQMDKSRINQIPEKRLPLQVLRNISPRIPSIKDKFIFHSNYLRISSNRHAINIVTIHDFTHQFFVRGIKQRLNYHQKKKAIRGSDGIVCISQSTCRDLYKFFPEAREKNVKVIYNGCSAIYSDRTKTAPAVTLQDRYILFVGSRGGYKNFKFALDVLGSSSYHLVVAGSAFAKSEEEAISGFKGRVTLFNNVTDEKLRSLYQHAHALIYPSLYEGFGIPLLEAMNCGCPAIAFNNSSIPEIMGPSPLLLKNNDLQSTLSVLKALEDAQYRQSIQSMQYEQAGKFSWDRAYNEMKAFYLEMYQPGA